MSSWHRYRGEHSRRSNVPPVTAAATLFGGAVKLSGPFPAELDPDDLDGITGDMIDEVFDDWIDGHLPRAAWGGAIMGGVPNWDQRDRTPRCATDPAHGEMRQLLEYEGGEFTDGALHVFLCRHARCERLAFVAEF